MDLAPENRLRLCLWLSILFNLLIQLKFNGNHYNHFLENTLNSFVHLMVLYICLALLWPCEIQLSSSSMPAPVKYSGRIAGNLIDWSQFKFMEVLMSSNNLMRCPWSFSLPLLTSDWREGMQNHHPCPPPPGGEERGSPVSPRSLHPRSPSCHSLFTHTMSFYSSEHSPSLKPTKPVQKTKRAGDFGSQ